MSRPRAVCLFCYRLRVQAAEHWCNRQFSFCGPWFLCKRCFAAACSLKGGPGAPPPNTGGCAGNVGEHSVPLINRNHFFANLSFGSKMRSSEFNNLPRQRMFRGSARFKPIFKRLSFEEMNAQLIFVAVHCQNRINHWPQRNGAQKVFG